MLLMKSEIRFFLTDLGFLGKNTQLVKQAVCQKQKKKKKENCIRYK